jgi:hypothetical protein
MPNVSIRQVKVPKALVDKLEFQPEYKDAIDTIGQRLSRRGKGLGERRNVTNRERLDAGMRERISFTTFNYPRRTGYAKTKKLTGVFYAMTPNVIRKLVQRVQARWAA